MKMYTTDNLYEAAYLALALDIEPEYDSDGRRALVAFPMSPELLRRARKQAAAGRSGIESNN